MEGLIIGLLSGTITAIAVYYFLHTSCTVFTLIAHGVSELSEQETTAIYDVVFVSREAAREAIPHFHQLLTNPSDYDLDTMEGTSISYIISECQVK